MKKVFNNSIFMFILGAVIFGSIGVIATTQIQANQITYTKNNVDTTLDVALDDLYTDIEKYNNFTITLRADGWSNTTSSNAILFFSPSIGNNYAYFKLDGRVGSNTSTCELKASSKTSGTVTLDENIEYSVQEYNHVYVREISNDTQASYCKYNLTFYNK